MDRSYVPDLVEQVSPAVVQVDVEVEHGAGNGSGFVISTGNSECTIVTNAHVIADASAEHVAAVFQDGASAAAEVRGVHPILDIAVLQPKRGAKHSLDFREKGATKVGEPVIALGSPLGLQGTVTSGIVSGLDRLRPGVNGVPATMLQTDAPVIHGNSGGPLVGTDGKVVGVNTQIHVAAQGQAPGISYAIPAPAAQLAVEAILEAEGDEVERPTVGLPLSEHAYHFSSEERAKWGQAAGALVKSDPAKKTPAWTAGLRAGDVIVAIEDEVVDDPADVFTWLLDRGCLARDCEVHFVRGEKRKKAKMRPEVFKKEE